MENPFAWILHGLWKIPSQLLGFIVGKWWASFLVEGTSYVNIHKAFLWDSSFS